ncbi:MAG: hypothetical protein CMJ25_30980 [Phycisphaerae bacterium]|nr:hypothetical protein [Phycisphaerae bacterium]
MDNNLSKKKFNRNSITIKIDSVYSLDAFSNFKYNEKETELTHDTLEVLLNSPNPLKKEYGFDELDFEYIAHCREKQKALIDELSFYLKKLKR